MDLRITERAILTPRNSSVDQINVINSQELLHREETFYPVLTVQVTLEILYSILYYYSIFYILPSADSTSDPRNSTRFPMEFLNKLTSAGFPPHHLCIKKGMVCMLLRSLSSK